MGGREEERDGEVAVTVEGEFAAFVAPGGVAEEAKHEDGFSVGVGGVSPVDEVDDVVDEVGAEGVAVSERLEDEAADVEWGEVRDRYWHARSVSIGSLFGQSPRT